jgi:OmpA-OmpF porin, OOP family
MLKNMRKNLLFFVLAAMLLNIHQEAKAQDRYKEKYRNKANDPVSKLPYSKKIKWADQLFKEGSYFNAIDYYNQLKSELQGERNPYVTHQLAECYRYTRDYVPSAHFYLESYNQASKVYPRDIFYGALMLKQQGEYQQAIDAFTRFVKDNPKSEKILKKRCQVEIDGCNKAMISVKDPQPQTIVNCGPNVNSAYTELAPVPLGDTALLFATMRQNAVIETDKNHKGGDYMSRFMVSHKQPGYVDSFQWPLPFLDGKFNNPSVDVGNGCFSPGGDRFYFTKCQEADSLKITCAIYVSNFKPDEEKWSEPEIVPGGVNEDGSSNTQPNVAKVGKKEVLFFSSDRKLQGRGGFDIWYSIIDPRNGSYRRPQNAGKQINTTGNEGTPYYDSRVGKLYFSSDGWTNFGGFDIFEAKGGPSRYTDLQNEGYPINSSADDLYFVKDPLGKPDAYVVSNRIGSIALKNPTCCDDIWRIQYEPRLVVIGKVENKRTNQIIAQDVVKMVDQKGEMNTYNSEDGNFLFNMSRGHSYVLTADKQGYSSGRVVVSTMDVKRTDPDDTVQAIIYLDSIMNSFEVSNIYYDYDKATLRPESVGSLDSLVSFMKDNPSLTVEIYSFTDSKGTDQYNEALSQRRAQSVLDYLEKNGIERTRMIPKGFGDKHPVAPNTVNGHDAPENRQLNRRTEFRIVADAPTRRVLYNSAKPGTMDEQEKNLKIDENSNEDEPQPGNNNGGNNNNGANDGTNQ